MDCLDDDQIASYLARTLRGAELAHVEHHLSSCDDCLAVACAAGDGDAAAAPRQFIGRYRIQKLLGEGGMGSVFVARDPQLDRDIALKLVRADHRTRPEMHARLAREARAMARVRHPNVIAIYDSGEVDEGVYIAMELVEGETLKQWLARERRSWQEIVRIFAQACRGLAAAHAVGIVHRDFKPENVLIGGDGRVAVGDFGVATLNGSLSSSLELAETADGSIDAAPPADANLVTRTGALIGTPRYMSPEQVRGEKLDARTDQYSVGVALNEALESRAQAAAPAAVKRVISRALAADREQRFATIEDLIAALDATIRPKLRSRALIAAALGVVIAGGVIAVKLAASASSAAQPASVAAAATAAAPRMRVLVGALANHTGSAELDDVVDPIVAEALTASTQLDVFSGPDLLAIASQFHAPAGADAAALVAAIAPSYRGPLLAVTGSIEPAGSGFALRLVARGSDAQAPSFDRAITATSADALVPAAETLARALREGLDHVPPTDAGRPVLSSSLAAIHEYARGQLAMFDSDPEVGAQHFARALELDPDFVEAHDALGLARYDSSYRTVAIEQLQRAAAGADRLPERRRLTVLGDYYGTVGRYSEAILAYQQLLVRWPGDRRAESNLVATALDGNMWPLALDVARGAAHDQPGLEIARRNLVIAEVGNERFDDAARDGAAMLAELPAPTSNGVTTTAIADVLLGRAGDARAVMSKLAALDPGTDHYATADLALYEGRLDDAAAALRDQADPAAQLVLAWVRARAGDRAGAATAARAAMAEDSMPIAYLAASAAVAAGDLAGADAKARAWSDAPEADRRLYGGLLAGDLALAGNRAGDAVTAYRSAGRIEDAWLAHERLARGELAAGHAAEGERELRWCLDHRGQGALVANPSLALLPEVALLYARSLDRRRADAASVRAAFQAVADLAPAAQHDPWSAEARRHLER